MTPEDKSSERMSREREIRFEPSGRPLNFEQVHGRTDIEFPQLEMVRANLDDVPQLDLPEGYTLRHYRPGDEEVWGRIMSEAFNPYWNADRFRRSFLPHFGFRPERVLFVCHEDRPVGSASAFQWPGIPHDQGYIHMVGVKKEHCGKKLGYWLAVACLQRFKLEGFKSAMLQTEDFRIPAIKHYLRLGFTPVLVHPGQKDRWLRVFRKMDYDSLGDELGIVELPVMSRFAFWWRTLMVANYIKWLNFKSDFSKVPTSKNSAS